MRQLLYCALWCVCVYVYIWGSCAILLSGSRHFVVKGVGRGSSSYTMCRDSMNNLNITQSLLYYSLTWSTHLFSNCIPMGTCSEALRIVCSTGQVHGGVVFKQLPHLYVPSPTKTTCNLKIRFLQFFLVRA